MYINIMKSQVSLQKMQKNLIFLLFYAKIKLYLFNNKRGENLKETLSIDMEERVKETNWRAVFKSIFGFDEEIDDKVSDLSDEENIKKCKDISKQVKDDFLKSVKYRSTLEAMFVPSDERKLKKERLKVDRSDKDRNKLTVENIKKSKARENEKGKEIVDD